MMHKKCINYDVKGTRTVCPENTSMLRKNKLVNDVSRLKG